jgi:exopolysaccharide biosynthesis polyprenyl glycosylphosphotransferase
MNQNKEKMLNVLLFITDFITLVVCYYIAGYMWLVTFKKVSMTSYVSSINGNIMTVLVTYIIAFLFYAHDGNFLARGKYEELQAVMKLNIIMGGIIAVYELLRHSGTSIPRGLYVLTICINIVAAYIVRLLLKRVLLSAVENGRSAGQMIMISTRQRAEESLKSKHRATSVLNRLAGIVILDEDMKDEEIGGVPVVANAHDMITYIKGGIVDEVYLNLDYDLLKDCGSVVMALEDMGITVHLRLVTLEHYKDYDMSLSKLDDIPVATFANRFYDYKSLLLKRVIDIAGSLVGLVIMGVAMIFVAPAIKIESKGPVFFKQKRVGKNGRYFYVYKFRSMYIDAEERKKELMAKNEMQGLMFKMKDDPRITKVGKFIRKTSIDELPQFINVLKGDMSLVGTRPPTVAEFQQYEGHHKRRLSMKPGITGMWQAYGRKTVTDFEEIVAMDLDYIDHWNLGLDLKIILRTFIAVFQGG